MLAGIAAAAYKPGALADFWRDNGGKTVRRLPVGVMPENVFWSLTTRDFADGMKTFSRMADDCLARGTYNCVTLTLRCNPELGDAETVAAAKACCARAHREGVKVYMDTDPRIARREFFARWPDERQSIAKVVAATATNGVATFSVTFDSRQDHMSWGSKSAYRPLNGKVLSALAVKRRADGSLDFAAKRSVEVQPDVDVEDWCGDGNLALSTVTVKGAAAGLAADETLVVTASAEYYSIDVFSPNLIPFCRRLMARYKEVGADGGMRDEWGFIPDGNPDLHTFFWSPNFAAAYRAETGRGLVADLPLLGCGPKGDAVRSAAIHAYMKLVLRRNVEIERDFYETDKRLFGDDVYVAKHPTWYSWVCPAEFFHNGLDWWQAPRDWAQTDEVTVFFAANGMAKKFGGPVWLNEGYTATPEKNVFRAWTYALCGGRQVYHGLYGDGPEMAKYNAMPWEESRVRKTTDLLAVGNVAAQSRIRLSSLITTAQVDSPVAYVFGHEDLVDWSAPGWGDYGLMKLFALLSKGWWADAYPASEFALGTFTVDDEGWLRVGSQRYTAFVTYRLSPSERAAFDALVKGRALKTKFFDIEDVAGIIACLERAGVPRQPIVKERTQAGPFYPEPDGTLRLIDGTAIRIKADYTHPRGLPVAGTLESNGAKIAFAAEGLFAARAEKGEVVAVAAGAFRKVEGPGLSLRLDEPEDVALLKIGGEWHGVWQTAMPEKPVPAALQALCRHWTKLALPAHFAHTGRRGAISDDLAGALEPIGSALAARRFVSPFGPVPTAQDNSPAAIAYYLSKGLDGKLADATVLMNDSAREDKDVWLGDRMFRLPPKGWVAVSADGRAGSMNVRLNRQRFMAGWCDDYTVWVKDGKIGLRNLNLTRGVVVRAAGDPTRPRKLGEESAFAVEVRDESGNLRTDGSVTVLADNCGAKKLLGETRFDLAAANPFTVRAKMGEPGFLRLTARLDKPAKSATATVPYAPEKIRPGTACPDDFDAVWAADLRRAEATVPLDPRREEVTGAYGGALKEYSVSFATTEGRRVYGYMAVPKTASPTNKMGVVVTIVGAGPGASYAWDARDDSITLVLNVVDYLPTDANVGKDYAAMDARLKKRFGVDGYSQAGWTATREEVFFHSQLIGLVRGLKWIAQLPEVDARDITYFGGSQGGGCGMAVVALSDGLFRKAFFYITAMSDMLRADVGGSDGWPGVRRHASDADALAVVKRNAPYFDACSFARRVRCPVRSTLGLEDTTCPPPNVMASFNELASKDRKIDFEPRVGHGISGLRFASIYEWLRAKDDGDFRLAWTERKVFDAELPFPDGVTFLPHGHYRAEVTSLPASMRFVDASGKTVLEFAAPTNVTPPYAMHVALSGRHKALVCAEQPNAAPKVADIVPMPLKTFDPSAQSNLSTVRAVPAEGMGAVAATQSAGVGQADVRFVTRGRDCRPYVEDGRVFFTFSARYYSTHLGVGSIDPARLEDGWRFEGTILFDYGDGRYANDVAAHLWLDDESGEWRAWTSNFSTTPRAPGGISVAVGKTSPLHGFSVMRSKTLGISGMNEDPAGCWDAQAGKWRLLVSAFTPNDIKAQMLESDRWDGGFKPLTGTVPEDSTGTTIARMNDDLVCLAGSVDRAYYVYSYPMLAKLGTLTMDETPWGDKTGWPHGRGWPAYLEVEKDGVLHKLLLTMDRENYPGMPNPNWTYGALFLYRAESKRLE